jgi:hypothetical protein
VAADKADDPPPHRHEQARGLSAEASPGPVSTSGARYQDSRPRTPLRRKHRVTTFDRGPGHQPATVRSREDRTCRPSVYTGVGRSAGFVGGTRAGLQAASRYNLRAARSPSRRRYPRRSLSASIRCVSPTIVKKLWHYHVHLERHIVTPRKYVWVSRHFPDISRFFRGCLDISDISPRSTCGCLDILFSRVGVPTFSSTSGRIWRSLASVAPPR